MALANTERGAEAVVQTVRNFIMDIQQPSPGRPTTVPGCRAAGAPSPPRDNAVRRVSHDDDDDERMEEAVAAELVAVRMARVRAHDARADREELGT